ncbi:MAG TPA: SGNH/GDSL hydrolase family protein [Bacilli bacterium]|jgi:hypothetical protein|nr:MAG: hypothetical protein BWX94_00194 [Tenericutes bacterium ADurb.Bin140]HOE78036.1 SGNH/GDSL hydrolase family protein [Bacilli bacterium]HON64108.1 SGNH/GDSL hydrolase family protein [Bacilli bacterium]HOR95743.1 SGNH/GDSL hydrolase family protein [Bacilli bacterium]HPD13109.1 SGNH/GDSL hydrolase family protein [Bacilli bacterium]
MTETTTKIINPATSEAISVYGLPYFAQEKKYYRFSEKDMDTVAGVNPFLATLAKHPAGGMLAFYSDTTSLKLHAKLSGILHMAHMTHVGQSGFDLYVGTKRSNLSFFSSTNYNISLNEYDIGMFNHSVKRRRLFVIDLPLYASVDSVELEIDSEAFVEPATDLFPKGRIVVYGTSITQGGCASRPGMAYPAIIAREIGYEFINYGFSGSGKGEKAIAELVASTQDVSMFILDYEGNADENQILENTLEPFVATIREKYPAVPILIISKIRMAKETHFLEKLNHALKMSRFQAGFVQKQRESGDANIYFLDGKNLLLPLQHEATVDGIHPTDLGFYFMANRIMKKILSIIEN